MNTRKAYTNVIMVILVVITFFSFMSIACDDGPSCGTLPGDTPCTPTSTPIGQNVVEDIINGAANANGDGVADTTECNNIVC